MKIFNRIVKKTVNTGIRTFLFSCTFPISCTFPTPAISGNETSAVESGDDDRTPNLLIIMADQWRSTAIGALGLEPVITPHTDKIAASGVVCSNATSHHPVSSPARASLMTGQYPLKHGVFRNCNSRTAQYGNELKEDAVCWSDILNDKGYSLGYLGKWHLDSPRPPYVNTSNNNGNVKWNEWCPPERRHGFSYWIAYGTYDRHLRPMYWDTDAQREDFYYVDQWGPEYEADKAIEFLSNKNNVREKDAPFALMVSMNPPHTVYRDVPDKYKNLYADLDVEALAASLPNCPPANTENGRLFRNQTKNYYACITGVDEQIGRIFSYLEESGLVSNTIVVIMSDHGNGLGLNNIPTKDKIEDVSMKIPLIFHFPEKLVPGATPVAIDIADVYPTIFGLMGKTEWIDRDAQGEDLSAYLRNDPPQGYPTVRPYLRYSADSPLMNADKGIRTDKYSYMIQVEKNKIQKHIYYDNVNDPYQLNNGWSGLSSERKSEVQQELKAFLRKIGDPFANEL